MSAQQIYVGKRYGLIGAAGFIAERHLRAIKDTGGDLAVAFDPNDSVGILDGYFPDADFFVEFERFDRHVDKMRRQGGQLHYVSICSPNYLHDAHVRFALRNKADAICEKPLVLNPWNLDALEEISKESGQKVYTILQLRLHPAIIALKEKYGANAGMVHDVDLTYITSRGHWYAISWKGDVTRSGGIATNIGIHFFDMLTWIFGAVRESTVHVSEPSCAAGMLLLERARVRWFLSTDRNDLPAATAAAGKRTYRSITVGGQEAEFSEGFTELHTQSYREILDGRGFGIADARPSVETAFAIRGARPIGKVGDYHPLAAGH